MWSNCMSRFIENFAVCHILFEMQTIGLHNVLIISQVCMVMPVIPTILLFINHPQTSNGKIK